MFWVIIHRLKLVIGNEEMDNLLGTTSIAAMCLIEWYDPKV